MNNCQEEYDRWYDRIGSFLPNPEVVFKAGYKIAFDIQEKRIEEMKNKVLKLEEEIERIYEGHRPN